MHLRRFALAAAVVGLAGCGDDTTESPTSPGQPTSIALGASPVAHEQIVYALARSLQDGSVRSELYHALSNSSVAEGKVHFQGYLRRPGVQLRARMAAAAGVSEQRLLELASGVQPLELYLPVPRHRQLWTGGAELIVASALREEEAPLGFTVGGTSVTLSREVPPDTPVLALVPVESFDALGQPHPWSGRKGKAMSLSGGELRRMDVTAATMMPDPCDPETGAVCDGGSGGTGGWSPPPNAVFTRGIGVREVAAFFRSGNDHEPWVKGAPEYRLVILGTNNLDQAAELRNVIALPEGGWAGSDDAENAKWRLFDPIPVVDWDTDYGNRVRLACFESDGGSPTYNFAVTGSTTIKGVTVNYSSTITEYHDEDDQCAGQYDLLVRTSTGSWTRVPDARKRDTSGEQFDGVIGELEWTGYGIPL